MESRALAAEEKLSDAHMDQIKITSMNSNGYGDSQFERASESQVPSIA